MLMGEGLGVMWSRMFTILFTNIFLKVCPLVLLGLSDKESVIASAVIPVRASRKQGEVKLVCLNHPERRIFESILLKIYSTEIFKTRESDSDHNRPFRSIKGPVLSL